MRSLLLRDALVVETCAHNLVSLGKLAREEHVGLVVGAGADPTYLQFAKHRAPLVNLGILIVPDCKAAPGCTARVVHGARIVSKVPGSIVHARGNHTTTRHCAASGPAIACR